ncbi:hypothetical protein [Leucobacter denitrificans]|uniref:PilN domain-containing protein n=1 Tax=Leucobacter denitrificans TaxID=683042 RepID=A0A7G9S7D0_9MICO|nr:hypothetical protein [Leucobacter denitrificans]QNN63755.1 hypothetical protein H9L06_05610 [Leucobacter denitrificans]
MSKKSRQLPVFGGTPKANLLPMQQRAEIIHDRTLPKLLIAVLSVGIVAVALVMAGMWFTGHADTKLSQAQQATEELNLAFAEHSELHHTRQDIEMISKFLEESDAGQALYVEVFERVRGVLPEASTVQDFQAAPALSDAAVSLCGTGAFAVTVTAQLSSIAEASAFVGSLSGLEASVCAELTSLSSGAAEAPVIATVQVMFDDTLAGPRSDEETP